MLENNFVQQIYIIDGVEYTFAQVCELKGVKYGSVYSRMRKGMEINEAINDCLSKPSTWGEKYYEYQRTRKKSKEKK